MALATVREELSHGGYGIWYTTGILLDIGGYGI